MPVLRPCLNGFRLLLALKLGAKCLFIDDHNCNLKANVTQILTAWCATRSHYLCWHSFNLHTHTWKSFRVLLRTYRQSIQPHCSSPHRGFELKRTWSKHSTSCILQVNSAEGISHDPWMHTMHSRTVVNDGAHFHVHLMSCCRAKSQASIVDKNINRFEAFWKLFSCLCNSFNVRQVHNDVAYFNLHNVHDLLKFRTRTTPFQTRPDSCKEFRTAEMATFSITVLSLLILMYALLVPPNRRGMYHRSDFMYANLIRVRMCTTACDWHIKCYHW